MSKVFSPLSYASIDDFFSEGEIGWFVCFLTLIIHSSSNVWRRSDEEKNVVFFDKQGKKVLRRIQKEKRVFGAYQSFTDEQRTKKKKKKKKKKMCVFVNDRKIKEKMRIPIDWRSGDEWIFLTRWTNRWDTPVCRWSVFEEEEVVFTDDKNVEQRIELANEDQRSEKNNKHLRHWFPRKRRE